VAITRWLLFVLLCGFGLLDSQVFGQWTMPEIVNRLSQEKAKVVSYRLIINQEPQVGTKFERCSWIVEQSDLGEHRVVAILRKNSDGVCRSWSMSGRSDEVLLNGSSDDKIISARKMQKEIDKDYSPPKCLDWRIIGFGFCGDITSSYEEVAKNVAKWDKNSTARFDSSKKERVVGEVDSAPATSFEFENVQGIRFTKFTLGSNEPDLPKSDRRNFSQWNVRYEVFGDLRLPVEASLLCGEDVVHYELEWKMVNDPIELGAVTGKRFTELIKGSKFQDQTR
jgi:hypothetical protein